MGELPPSLRWLKRMVMILMVVMIVGFVLLIVTLITNLNADPLPLPERVTLPEGQAAVAFTQGTDWFAVVTDADEIHIYDRGTGVLRQTVLVKD